MNPNLTIKSWCSWKKISVTVAYYFDFDVLPVGVAFLPALFLPEVDVAGASLAGVLPFPALFFPDAAAAVASAAAGVFDALAFPGDFFALALFFPLLFAGPPARLALPAFFPPFVGVTEAFPALTSAGAAFGASVFLICLVFFAIPTDLLDDDRDLLLVLRPLLLPLLFAEPERDFPLPVLFELLEREAEADDRAVFGAATFFGATFFGFGVLDLLLDREAEPFAAAFFLSVDLERLTERDALFRDDFAMILLLTQKLSGCSTLNCYKQIPANFSSLFRGSRI
jgi:hypothetical protein